jgi:hypothetical protein
MVRIAGKMIDTFATYSDADIEIIVPNGADMSDEEVLEIRNADLVEEISDDFGKIGGVIASYVLLGWKSVERLGRDMRFRWQTYRSTDLDQMKKDNEDITQAILELAAIIGGDGNG